MTSEIGHTTIESHMTSTGLPVQTEGDDDGLDWFWIGK